MFYFLYLQPLTCAMKIKTLGWSLLVLLLLINIWAVFHEVHWVKYSSFIFYFMAAMVLVLHRYRKFNKYLFLFIGCNMISYLAKSLPGGWFANEIALACLGAANIILFVYALKFIEIKKYNKFALLYFILIVGINASLLGYHVMEIREFVNNNLVFSFYVMYYLNLLILAIVAFTYYLNSYSRKSMFFISLSLVIIFADLLREMGVFFPTDLSVEMAESILRLGSAVFAVHFFTTEEKQLRLFNLI